MLGECKGSGRAAEASQSKGHLSGALNYEYIHPCECWRGGWEGDRKMCKEEETTWAKVEKHETPQHVELEL